MARRRLLTSIRAELERQRTAWRVRLRRDARAGVPAAVVSGLLHAAFLAFLAMLVVLRDEAPALPPLDLSWLSDAALEAIAESPEFAPIQLAPTEPQSAVASPPPVEPPPDEPVRAVRVAPVDVSHALSGRLPGREGDTSQPGGGNEEARKSVDRALGWLARQQQRDGRWQLHAGYADAGSVRTDTGATALALLAFLGRGETHQAGDHQETVRKGLDWLLGVQRPSGDLFDILEEGRDAHFYAHAQATIALCEALALTDDEHLREPAERAVQFLVAAQNPSLGGWKYRPLDATGIGDLSVTGWALTALHTARMAGIEVVSEAYLLAWSFLDSVQETPRDGAFYKYRPDWAAAPAQRWSMTAEGLLCRQWLGWERDHPAQRRGVEFLLAAENAPEWKEGRRNLYAWYYTAQVLHNRGGDEWRRWYSAAQSEIIAHQAAEGSWHPTRPRGAPLEYADGAGRLYLTVLCVLVLETPYRHAAVYESQDE